MSQYKNRTGHFNKAKNNINDEYYTSYKDIKKELSEHNLKDKIIHLPADKRESNFYKYFKKNFHKLKLKKIILTHIDNNFKIEFNGEEEFITLIKSGDMFKQNYNNIDIIITNPPFSLIVKFIEHLTMSKKKFILLGPITVGLRPKVFNLFKNNLINLSENELKHFKTPTGEEKLVRAFWYYNTETKPTEPLKDKKIQTYYHNPDLIFISTLEELKFFNIKGQLLAVPITFLKYRHKYNFKIIDLTEHQKLNSKEHPNIIKRRDNKILKEKMIPAIITYYEKIKPNQIYWTDIKTGQNYIEPFSRITVLILSHKKRERERAVTHFRP